jgi:hypothetical protein
VLLLGRTSRKIVKYLAIARVPRRVPDWMDLAQRVTMQKGEGE